MNIKDKVGLCKIKPKNEKVLSEKETRTANESICLQNTPNNLNKRQKGTLFEISPQTLIDSLKRGINNNLESPQFNQNKPDSNKIVVNNNNKDQIYRKLNKNLYENSYDEELNNNYTDRTINIKQLNKTSVNKYYTNTNESNEIKLSPKNLENEFIKKSPILKNILQTIPEISEPEHINIIGKNYKYNNITQSDVLKNNKSKINSNIQFKHSSPKITQINTENEIEKRIKYNKQIQISQELTSDQKIKQKLNKLKRNLSLCDSPNSKQIYKDITINIKNIEGKNNLTENNNFAQNKSLSFVINNLFDIPEKLWYKIFLELADLAKRENLQNIARLTFIVSIHAQPYSYQNWLEFAKMEDEYGQFDNAAQILLLGLKFCKLNDSLLLKTLKILEKIGKIDKARQIIGKVLEGKNIERIWKIGLEGALMEARAGKQKIARCIILSLCNKCPSHGPLWYELSKLEEKYGDINRSLNACANGIKNSPRHGPLWLQACKLISTENSLESLMIKAYELAPREILWKIQLEASLTCEKQKSIGQLRTFMQKCVKTVPKALRWKVFLCGARAEARFKQLNSSLILMEKSLHEAPDKQKPQLLAEQARLYELTCNQDKARNCLQQASQSAKHEWKVAYERILLELRAGELKNALIICKNSLKQWSAAGRLWATYIQLTHCNNNINNNINIDHAFNIFKKAIKEVPKSGEVWCEGARLFMNPLWKQQSLEKAETLLTYATQFTPQQGDSFIEWLRLKLIKQMLINNSCGKEVDIVILKCINAEPNYGQLWMFFKNHIHQSPKEVCQKAKENIINEIRDNLNLQKKYGKKHQNYCSNDFWTGHILFNRSQKNLIQIDQEHKQNILSGSDQIFL